RGVTIRLSGEAVIHLAGNSLQCTNSGLFELDREEYFGLFYIFSPSVGEGLTPKLKSRWSGPFTISHVYLYGTGELAQPDEANFKVNSRRLKHYFREDVPKLVVPDLQTFPKDH
nr:reverse transcriptase domain-containing protein [Tanacetum cinerariifolium]